MRIPYDIVGLAKFAGGLSFSLDCTNISLFNNDSVNCIQYRGPGSITYEPQSGIRLKLYVVETNDSQFALMKRISEIQSGTIYSDSQYFQMEALTLRGDNLTAGRLLPSINWISDTTQIAQCRIRTLSWARTQPPSKNAIALIYNHDIDLPFSEMTTVETADSKISTRNKHSFIASGLNVVVRNLENCLIIEAYSSDDITNDLDMRIAEALCYITSRPYRPSIKVRDNADTRHVSFTPTDVNLIDCKSYAPLMQHHLEWHDHAWQLFCLYFEYISKTSKGPDWNYCSYHLNNVMEASRGPLDNWGIGLCIAIEGIASLVDEKLDAEEKNNLSRLRTAITEWLSERADLNQYTDRVSGLLGMMFQIRVQDRIRKLETGGHAYREDVSVWGKVRNRNVHPKYSDAYYKGNTDMQLAIDEIKQLSVLMHHVVFYLIGYNGKFTDYATRNFPYRHYPLTTARRGA